MRIIRRRIDIERVEKAKPWRMIYGRRKTGKTFLIERFTEYDRFYFVNRDGTVFDKLSGEKYNYDEFMAVFKVLLGRERIVVDEFHRLPEEFLDYLHANAHKGELTLISSTLWLAKRLLEAKSPLLGLVYPLKIGLIDERDILIELSKELEGRELIEASTYLREPFLIPYYRGNIREFLTDFLHSSNLMIRELIGEIFSEEDKELSEVYETVLQAIADGKITSGKIANVLISRKLLESASSIQKYLATLASIGLIEKVPLYGKSRFRYYITSPLLDLHYYLEEKYAYTELEVSREFIRKAVDKKVPLHIEWFFRNLLAKLFGLRYVRLEEKNLEVDIALLEFKKLKVVGEVKWKKFIDRGEIRKIEENLGRFKCRKILIVPDKENIEREPEDIEVWDIKDILEKVKKHYTG